MLILFSFCKESVSRLFILLVNIFDDSGSKGNRGNILCKNL